MENLSSFCTCERTACPLHPANHNQGCAPCIRKNLRAREIPSCFFHLIEGSGSRSGDKFEDFARLVLQPSSADAPREG